MTDPLPVETDPEVRGLQIILAASQHNIQSLETLLRNGSANFQDQETGFSPLHAAIAACEDTDFPVEEANGVANTQLNGNVSSSETTQKSVAEAATKTVKLLLQNGAIWNLLDKNNETPGCLALRLGLKGLYEIMADAGVRSEMLLNRMDEYEALADSDDEVEEGDDEVDGDTAVNGPNSGTAQLESEISSQGVAAHANTNGSNVYEENNVRNEDYLQASLRFQDGRILDDSGNAVMMAWETDLMKKSADSICPNSGFKVLNIGHGLGIIDALFQRKSPAAHHIIEAHPAVLERMRKDGWYQKPNVTVHEGRWQDVIPKILEQGILFDAVYFDTFAEDYKAFRDFFSDCLIGLLEDKGKWSFFHGLGADREICYDVYTKVVEMDLFEAGFDTEWDTLNVADLQETEWQGVKRRYWALQDYKLPICSFIG